MGFRPLASGMSIANFWLRCIELENPVTQVAQAMTRGVRYMAPDESVMKAAQAMSELDIGAIPICDGDRLIGMVTDRDIVLRGVAQGRAADSTPLSAVMTSNSCWCFEDQSVEEAAEQMREAQIRRMPVVDRDNHLVGMLSLGDIATKTDPQTAAGVLEEVSEPSRPATWGESSAAALLSEDSPAYEQRKEAS